MRILQIIPSLEIGGAEAVVDTLSRKLAEGGNEVSILTESDFRGFSKSSNINYLSISSRNSPNRLAKILKLAVWPIKNRKIIGDFQIIHCHLTRGMLVGLVITLLPIRSKPRVIGTCHSVGGNISSSRILLEKLCAKRFDAFVLMAITRDWDRFRRKNKKIAYIPNGIEPILAKSKLTAIRKHSFMIGTLSRLTEDRKPWLFINLFSKIQDLNPDIKFIIGGDGPLRTSLESMAKDANLVDISWTGQINDKPDFFSKLDLYVTLTVGEISGIAGLEAISAGLPVYGIQISEDTIREENSFISSLSDLDTLASNICEAVNNSSELAKVRENQKNIFMISYQSSMMLQKYSDLYENLLSKELM